MIIGAEEQKIGALEEGDLRPENVKQIATDLGVTEDDVLLRVGRGLRQPQAALSDAEADWVLRRLAELLGWPWGGAP